MTLQMRKVSYGFRVSVVFIAILAILPFFLKNSPYWLHIGILCMMYSCYATCWNMVAGFTGIFSLGFQALSGIGGYVSSLVAMHMGISPWISMFIGAICAMVVGAVFSVPCLKLRLMPYIAISGLCLGEVVRVIVANLTDLTRGEMGLWGMPNFTDIGPISFAGGNRFSYWYLVLIFLIVYLAIVAKIVGSPLGRALGTIRDSQDAAVALGVNVPQTKVKVYMISAFMMGLIGAFYAHYMQILTPNSVIGPQMMTNIVCMTLFGGLGTITGPILGAFIMTILTETLRFLGDYRLIVYGLVIILTIIFMRKGLWGTAKPKVQAWVKKMEEKKAAPAAK